MFHARAAGASLRLLIDSGASIPFLSEAWAVQHGFTPKTAEPLMVAMPDGVELVCDKVVKTPLREGSYRDTIEFRLVPLAATFDAVLGSSWLVEHNPAIDFSSGRVELQHRGKLRVMLCMPPAAPQAPKALLTPLHF